jgi:hypothetical protein
MGMKTIGAKRITCIMTGMIRSTCPESGEWDYYRYTIIYNPKEKSPEIFSLGKITRINFSHL